MGLSPACEKGMHASCEGVYTPDNTKPLDVESCMCQHHSAARAAAAIADRNAAPRLVPMMVAFVVDAKQRPHVYGPFDDRDQAEVWMTGAGYMPGTASAQVLPLTDPNPLPR